MESRVVVKSTRFIQLAVAIPRFVAMPLSSERGSISYVFVASRPDAGKNSSARHSTPSRFRWYLRYAAIAGSWSPRDFASLNLVFPGTLQIPR